jgi:hypothetical protein
MTRSSRAYVPHHILRKVPFNGRKQKSFAQTLTQETPSQVTQRPCGKSVTRVDERVKKIEDQRLRLDSDGV